MLRRAFELVPLHGVRRVLGSVVLAVHIEPFESHQSGRLRDKSPSSSPHMLGAMPDKGMLRSLVQDARSCNSRADSSEDE